MNRYAWIAQYLGLQWKEGSYGPYKYDCWNFFRHIMRNHFGIDICSLKLKERRRWREVSKPKDGDAVICKPLHIGTYLSHSGGGVLHCVKGSGVIFTRMSNWSISGFNTPRFFRHESRKDNI